MHFIRCIYIYLYYLIIASVMKARITKAFKYSILEKVKRVN